MAVKKRSKISKVKKSNQLRTKLTKQGKLKKRHHAKIVPKPKTPSRPTNVDPAGEESSEHEDIEEMVEEEDLQFLRKAFDNKSYEMLQNIRLDEGKKPDRKRKSSTKEDEENHLEVQYEESNAEMSRKRQKYLLPIKTAEGVVHRVQEEEEEDSAEEFEAADVKPKEIDTGILSGKTEVSTIELLAARKEALQNQKFRIGILCSGLLENPELKVKNFKPLLEMLDRKEELKISVRKIVVVSLLEVFKDVLPAYQIKLHDAKNVKLKKEVKALREFEAALLKAYKVYLQNLEKMVSILKNKKKGDNRVFKEPEVQLALCALEAMSGLLVTHTYFNFAKNITHLVVPHLNNAREEVRQVAFTTVKEVFKTDKKGEASLEIVRSINKFVRSKHFNVHPDVLKVLLHLKLKGVDLDQEKEAEMNKKKLQSKKGNILRLSRRERKRSKRLEHIEKELLETKAEENVKATHQHLTDITKLVFQIYFKILKEAPSSKLLNAALEGLAKFAHCINIDFYHDLINVLDLLIEKEGLGYREQLCCVQTVFIILSHQGAAINIDPLRFYTYLYANLLSVHAGRNHEDLPIILKATEAVLIRRRKHLSTQRLLAFTKRLCSLSLHVLPNGSLGLLALMRQVLQSSKTAGLLLEDDSATAQGVYYAEMEEPEYCNAGATALWELLPLQRHYHPSVVEYSSAVARMNVGEAPLKNSMKCSAEQLYKDFDFSQVKFKPAVPAPAKQAKRRSHRRSVDPDLQGYVRAMLSTCS